MSRKSGRLRIEDVMDMAMCSRSQDQGSSGIYFNSLELIRDTHRGQRRKANTVKMTKTTIYKVGGE